MMQFITTLVRLIHHLIEEVVEEDQYEVARDFRWQLSNTGVDIEELRAHLDPTYWAEEIHPTDGLSHIQAIVSVIEAAFTGQVTNIVSLEAHKQDKANRFGGWDQDDKK